MAATREASFGDLLRQYRRAAGLTQEELAARARVSPRAISDLERGQRNRPWRDTVQLLATALGLPPTERAELEAAARRASPPAAGTGGPGTGPGALVPRHNLPIQVTSFVGRERERAEVSELLTTSRLLTLTGCGGCGKTRLALQVAPGLLETYPEGVWFVDLAPLADPRLVTQAAATALGLPERPGQPIEATLLAFLRPRCLLLILDNCEHLLAACAHLADAILRTCPRVRILATSREPLRIAGEVNWRVPSLSVPQGQVESSPEAALASDAVQLFVERAGAAERGFRLTAQNAAAIGQVCRRLDGIPLAIELAAARVRVLSVEQIATRLDDRFRLLTGGSRTALRRHQTLRATLDWSHDLLSDAERLLLRRLAVFAGGWSLEAAEAVCAGDGLPGDEVLDCLAGLVDKSMVAGEGQGGEKWYHLLETVRAYAGEKLVAAGEPESLRNRHRDWCRALAEQAEPEWWGPASETWIARLRREYANVRGGLEWCLATDPDAGLRIAASVWPLWYLDADWTEGTRWLRAFLAQASAGAPARGEALLGAGHCARAMRPLRQSRSWTEESLAIARATGDQRLAGRALFHLGNILTMEQDYAGAQAALEESAAVFREIGDRPWEGMGLRDLGNLARIAGDYQRAGILYHGSLSILRSVGHRWNTSLTLLVIGYLARQQDDPERARAAFEECLALAANGRMPFRVVALRGLGELERSLGHFDAADAFLREGLVEIHERGRWAEYTTFWLYPFATLLLQRGSWVRGVRLAAVAPRDSLDPVNTLPPDVADHDAAIQSARTALGDAAFAAAWAEGQAMTLEQAVAYALEDDITARELIRDDGNSPTH